MANFMSEENRKKGPIQDFVADLIDQQCYSKAPDQKVAKLDVDLLCDLGDANGIDTTKYRAQKDNKNAPGRIRMTLAQMLRARAKRRHGLYNLDGDVVNPNEEFELTEVPTETLDGEKIAKPKPAKEEAKETEAV